MKTVKLLFLLLVSAALSGQSLYNPAILGQVNRNQKVGKGFMVTDTLITNGVVISKNLVTDNAAANARCVDGSGKDVLRSIASIVNGASYFSISFDTLVAILSTSRLINGAYYVLTDYHTIYDQPDYNADGTEKTSIITKTGPLEHLVLLATSDSTVDYNVESLEYPQDAIKYIPYDFTTAINNAPTKGRIMERIDDHNNRADFDIRAVLFKRYRNGPRGFIEYRDNDSISAEFPTWDYNQALDNSIGDFFVIHPVLMVNFDLPNIVISGLAINNTFGLGSYNNTLADGIFSTNKFGNTVYGFKINNGITGNYGTGSNNVDALGVYFSSFTYIDSSSFGNDIGYINGTGYVSKISISDNVQNVIFNGSNKNITIGNGGKNIYIENSSNDIIGISVNTIRILNAGGLTVADAAVFERYEYGITPIRYTIDTILGIDNGLSIAAPITALGLGNLLRGGQVVVSSPRDFATTDESKVLLCNNGVHLTMPTGDIFAHNNILCVYAAGNDVNVQLSPGGTIVYLASGEYLLLAVGSSGMGTTTATLLSSYQKTDISDGLNKTALRYLTDNNGIRGSGAITVYSSRNFAPTDKGKLLLCNAGVHLHMPTGITFEDGNTFTVEPLDTGVTVQLTAGGDSIAPALNEVTVFENGNPGGNSTILPISTAIVNDAGKKKTSIKYLMDQNAFTEKIGYLGAVTYIDMNNFCDSVFLATADTIFDSMRLHPHGGEFAGDILPAGNIPTGLIIVRTDAGNMTGYACCGGMVKSRYVQITGGYQYLGGGNNKIVTSTQTGECMPVGVNQPLYFPITNDGGFLFNDSQFNFDWIIAPNSAHMLTTHPELEGHLDFYIVYKKSLY